MAYPFGGHPRFNDYLEWARLSEGCAYKSGFIRIGGKLDTTILIENPANGKHVIVTLPITEYLVPTMVNYLDRRLGLSSPFSSVGPPEGDEAT